MSHLQILLEAGANIDAVDHDGNTPLHVKCYGESGESTDLECIEKMVMIAQMLIKAEKSGALLDKILVLCGSKTRLHFPKGDF